MMRQRWVRRVTKFFLLAIPGAALLQTSTSCGDVIRQTLLSSGADFLGTAATTLLNQVLSNAVGTDTTDTTDTTTTQ